MTIFDFWYFWVDWWKWWKAMWLTRQGVGVREGWNLQYLLVISEFFYSNLCHFIWIGWKAKFWHFHKKRVGVFWKRVLPSMFRVFPQLLYSPLWANWLFHHTMHAQCWNTFVNNTLCSLFVLLLLHSILTTLWANCISHQSTKLFNFLSLLGEL